MSVSGEMVLIQKFNCLGACGSSPKRAHTRHPRYGEPWVTLHYIPYVTIRELTACGARQINVAQANNVFRLRSYEQSPKYIENFPSERGSIKTTFCNTYRRSSVKRCLNLHRPAVAALAFLAGHDLGSLFFCF